MKVVKLLLIILCGFAPSNDANCQDYIAAMKSAISKLDVADNEIKYMDAANTFTRIMAAKPSEWLPPYYTAYSFLVANYFVKSKDKRDLLLDRAEDFVKIAEANSKNKTEIELILLRAYIYQSRVAIDPPVRVSKYQSTAEKLLEQANKIDPENPRYYFLVGQNLFYTPRFFGGGKGRAKKFLETAIQKYKTYTAPSELHPHWDLPTTLKLLSQCN
ncbi:MAG: hypothetical protein WAT19_03960 [Ferruginibacter sp.]